MTVDPESSRILTINTGSSSLKAALYCVGESDTTTLFQIRVDRIGQAESSFRITNTDSSTLLDEQDHFENHDAALRATLSWLREKGYVEGLDAVGHRVVHGGRDYNRPQVVTDSLLSTLRELIPIDPNHLPQAIQAIDATRQSFPTILQVACFDTAFHRTMPRVAQLYGLPRKLEESGVIRYGFHGLSYEYIIRTLTALDPDAATGRIIIAHLGNGASMAAVRDSVSVDTSMGFSPTGGLIMGTRSGDLDPGVLLYLMESQGLSPTQINTMVNGQAGLLGVSETSSDMRDLLARETDDPRAEEAVSLFCYDARKFVGAFAAALGGIDMLVFTGGIGERAATIRERICDGLAFLGIRIDPERNAGNAPIISMDTGHVTVRVIQTNEDRMIAEHTCRVLHEREVGHVRL